MGKAALTHHRGTDMTGCVLPWLARVTIYFYIGCTWAAVVCVVVTLTMFYGGIHVLLTKKNGTGLTFVTVGLVFGNDSVPPSRPWPSRMSGHENVSPSRVARQRKTGWGMRGRVVSAPHSVVLGACGPS